MKQTAVEWFWLNLTDDLIGDLAPEKILKIYELIKQAKEMEKEQIIDACNQTEFEDIDGMGIHETITKGEEYYNEIFKSE